jgi:hypothetical protein
MDGGSFSTKIGVKTMFRITSKFGSTESFRSAPHRGLDFAMPEGTELRAIQEGTIRVADYGSTNAGKTVFIEGEDGKTYIFGHLKDFAVESGQKVHVGDLLGHSGSTGFSTGPHLHLGIKEGGQFIDPAPYADLIQKMGQIKPTAEKLTELPEKLTLDASSIFHQAMEQFTGTLSDMTINFITFIQSHAIHGALKVLNLILACL